MSPAGQAEKISGASTNPIPSSSPAFGTPIHPVNPRRTVSTRAPPALRPKATVLPILLPPATLRPLAFRTFTKKHNLTLTATALQALATFIGKQCGSAWREEGLAEKVLEEVAKSWKKSGGQVIVDGDSQTFKGMLKTLEGSMSGGRIAQSLHWSRQSTLSEGHFHPALESQASFGISSLDVAADKDESDEEDLLADPREWIKVIGAFEQPKMVYSVAQKRFERSASQLSFFPPPSRKTDLFRQRYHLVHQRILRNEAFQAPSFSSTRSAALHPTGSTTNNERNSITPIANLLGRAGTAHLLLGMLTVSPTGSLSLSDLTGTIALDIQHARPIPEHEVYFAPGMMVLVEGSYEEDGGPTSSLGASGGIGGTISGKFLAFSLGHPPCEERTATLGGADEDGKSGPAFGWTDFLGVGSQRATGSRMNRIAAKLLDQRKAYNIVIASDVHLDLPSTLSALRTMFRTYTPSSGSSDPIYPLAIVLMGNFSSKASLTGLPGAGSLEYKEHFDALASVLADFPRLVAHTTLIFIPGDNDAWPSAFSAGAATPLPRKPIPQLFTNRIRRVVAEANREVWGVGKAKGKEGEVIWASNPSRLSWFGVKGEMAILRDDVMGRLHRTSVRFNKPEPDVDDDDDIMPFAPSTQQKNLDAQDAMDLDVSSTATANESKGAADYSKLSARTITRTILSQSHLSPFSLSTRPLHWDFAHALNLYPLPTCLVLADSEAPAFVVRYFKCTVMNPGRIDESGGRGRREGRARWVEFDIRTAVGVVRMEG